MNYDDIKTTLINRLGNRGDLATEIELELANAQENLETSWGDSTLPWFLLTSEDLTLSAGNEYVALPTNFIRQYDEANVTMDDEIITKSLIKDLDDSTCYDRYAIVGSDLYINDVDEDNDRTINITYYAAQPKLASTNQNNEWTDNAAELLIAKTGGLLATYIRDTELTGIFRAAEGNELGKLISAIKEREWSGHDMKVRVG